MTVELREYQEEAVNSFFEYVRNGGRSGVISAPTGSGKSIIIAEICRKMCEHWPNTRVIVATHRYELILQNEATFREHFDNSGNVGIYSSGLRRFESDSRITFVGIQSVTKLAHLFGKVDLLVIDEAHFVNPDEGTQYARFIHDLREINGNLVVLGLSATPYRLDNGLLYEGEQALFDSLIYDITITRLVDEGYLAPVVSKSACKTIDLSNVRKTAGEFNKKDLELAANQKLLVQSAVNEIVSLGHDRSSWLVFAAGIEHGEEITAEIRKHGVSCELITGETEQTARFRILEEFKQKKLRCIVNVEILVNGFDAPCIDLIALLTATQSTAKYVQCVGRGTRVCDGKENCLLLDFGGNVERHGVIDAVEPKQSGRGKGTGEAPAKTCPECRTICHIKTKICPDCGHVFPEKPKHAAHAYSGAVLKEQDTPHWVNVYNVGYNRWPGRNGKPDTIRCDFFTDGRNEPYSMWLALDHGGFPAKMARFYVNLCGGRARTVREALEEQYDWVDPVRIFIERDRKNPKYWRITKFDFPDNTKGTKLDEFFPSKSK